MQFKGLGILAVPILLIWTGPALAFETTQQPFHAGEKSPDENLPSMELLEFLADWEDEGQWKGPEFFAEISAADREKSREKTGDKLNGKQKGEPDD